MTFREKYPGWRLGGLTLSILSIVLTVGLLVTLAVFSKLSDFGSSHVLFEGSCDSASSMSTGIQFAINVISTTILASSNFFMQVIVAPTRQDVDKAHGKRKSLEIGVLSLSNLSSIPGVKVALFLILGLSSIPVHLFFNSVVLESSTSTDALIVLAAETFLKGEQQFSSPGIVESETINIPTDKERLQVTLNDISESVQQDTSSWEQISVDECHSRYNSSKEPLVNYRHAIMVVTDPRQNSTSGWANENGHAIVSSSELANSIWTAAYLLRGDPIFLNNTILQPNGTRIQSNDSNALASVIGLKGTSLVSSEVLFNGTFGSLEAKYCLSEKYSRDCKLDLQLNILTIVCSICVLKSSVELIWMVKSRHYRPLITPGDSICSFIMIPDETTAGLCTYERRDFTSLRRRYWRDPYTNSAPSRTLDPNKRVLGSAVPREVWALHIITCAIALGVISFYFFANSHPNFNASNFGQNIQNPTFLNHIDIGSSGLLATTFIVNLPQLILSIFYVTFNSIFTYLVTELEWASYVPLIISSTVLHWLYSKSTYVAIYDGHDGYHPYESIPDYGFNGVQVSPTALLISIILTFVVVPLPFLFALRPRPSAMVVGGTCSAVISAACHSVAPGCKYIPPRPVEKSFPVKKNAHIVDSGTEEELEEAHQENQKGIGADSSNEERGQIRVSEINTGDISDCQNEENTPFVRMQTEGTAVSYESMAQEPLKWGLVWKTKLGDNTDPCGKITPYYWMGEYPLWSPRALHEIQLQIGSDAGRV
ncbi:hypothetical protein FHL15_005622 [Xylaria flabelliformis]|uniref:DUF6536 domain-containing protein n=1 Tax=Xylaria flabelliformis TaxID=2512241 RepID=A0A553HZG3_9PEZI|nr:hypothetical protein FHL15_005622 [Xylaria flabelliformis]